MGQIAPEDIKRLSSLEDAGIRGGIHSARTYLMALHDGSLWIWKQTGVEERDEIFVYELAKRMFRSIVPEVQPVFVPKLGWGSAMRKVAGVPAGRVDGLHGYFHGNDEMMADLAAMLVLDYMTGNPDRHSNNWFIMHNDRLAAIDNGWAGEDLAMSFADVFQPARLAGMMEDERLWPQLLAGITSLIQELSGKGDEVRALAEEIGIDKKEAVEMVRLWEPKLVSMAKLIRAEAGKVEKARVYIEPGQQPPLGTRVEEGPRGGHYYESRDIPVGDEPGRTDEEVGDWATRQAAGVTRYPAAEGARGVVPDHGDFGGDLDALFEWVSAEEVSYEDMKEFFAGVWQTDAADIDVVDITVSEGESVEVRLRLLDPETGEKMGYMDRTLHRAFGRVHHDVFELDAKYRGHGTALAVNTQAENKYREMGFETVDLQADISVGKYAWAPQGYDFADEYEKDAAFSNLIRFRWDSKPREDEIEAVEERYADILHEIDSRGGLVSEEEWAEERKLVEEQRDEEIESLQQGTLGEPTAEFEEEMLEYHFEHAWDLAAMDDGESYDGMPLGKAFMLSNYMSEWSAYKNLNPDSPGTRIGAMYYEKKKHKIKGKEARKAEAVERLRRSQRAEWVKENLEPVSQRLRQKMVAAGNRVSERAWELRGGTDGQGGTPESRAEANRIVGEYNERKSAMWERFEEWAKQQVIDAGFDEAEAAPQVAESARLEAPSEWRDTHTRPLTAAVARELRALDDKALKLIRERQAGRLGIQDITDRLQELKGNLTRRYRNKGLAMLREAGYEPYGDFMVEPPLTRAVMKAEGGRFPVELPAGSKVREGVTDEGAHDIDEDTDQEWRDALKEMRFEETVRKARTYVESPEQVPPGAQMETGPRGGTYYESEPQMPGFEQPPEERYHKEEGTYTRPTTVLGSVDKEEAQIAALDAAESESIAEALERQPEYKGYSRHTSEVRGAVKDAITSRIAAETGLKYNTVKGYMGSWAGSSSDENVHSLAMQMAAAALFGLPATEFIKKSWYEAGGRGIMGEPGGDDTKQKRLDEATAILRVMYADTQDYLAKHGIESLVLFRGMRWFDDEGENTTPQEFLHYGKPPEGVTQLTHDLMRQESEFHANPLSSWAYSFTEARLFANYKPEGASSFEGEYNWEDPKFQEEAEELLEKEWREALEADPDLDEDSNTDYENWKYKFLENYGNYDVGMWAYQESDLIPPEMLPPLTRVMSVVEVPREKIIATALTGLGCLNEHEVVVSGGEFSQNTYILRDYDGSEKFPHFGDIEEHEMEAGEQYQRRKEPEEKPITGPEKPPPEIPEELLEERMQEMRNDPSLDTNETYSKMTTLLFEWWTRKAEKYRQGWNEVYADTTLSDHEKTMKLAPFDLAKAIHLEDYKQRLADAAESIGHVPPWSDDIKYAIEREYSRDRIAFLQRLVDGEIEPGEAKGIQERMYARTKVQDKINEMGYDPFDDKLVKLVAKYEAKMDALSKEKWPQGVEFSVWNKTQERKKARVRNAFNKKLGTFEKPVPVEKALRKARTYLKPGQKPPGGQQVEEGPRGGRYYESEGREAAEEPTGTRAMPPDKDAWWSMLEVNDHYKDAGTKFAEQMGRENPSAWKGSEVRGMLKKDLTKRIAEGTRIDETQVHHFVASWASSSSDDSAYSLSMQMAAARLFDLEPTSFVADAWANVSPEAHYRDLARPRDVEGINDPRWPEVAEKGKEYMMADATQILRHVYEQTQKWLRVRGIKKVTVGRGQGWKGDTLPDELRGLELTDEQFDRLYQTRLKQYNLKEQEALGRVDEQNMSEERREALHEKIKTDFEKARKTLKVDLGDDPLSMIDLIRQNEEFYHAQEWSKAVEDKFNELEVYDPTPEEEIAVRAAKRKASREIDAHFVETRRKMRAELDEMSYWEGELDFHQNPLSSWSINHDTARMFSLMRAHGRHTAVTMWSEVPAERIISVPFTGPGCLTEHEFLVAGGEIPVHFRASAFTEGERGHDPEAMKRHLDPWEGLVKVRGQKPA